MKSVSSMIEVWKNLYDFHAVKNICLCISEEPSLCWQNKQPLGVFKMGFALHVFKVESPQGIPAKGASALTWKASPSNPSNDGKT